jgi:hypothetical protein
LELLALVRSLLWEQVEAAVTLVQQGTVRVVVVAEVFITTLLRFFLLEL